MQSMSRCMISALIVAGFCVFCLPALGVRAQTDDVADNDAAKQETRKTLEEVVVTGSRIKGAADTGILPTSILTGEDLATFGSDSTGDLLSNLAQAGAFEFNDSEETPNAARGDVASVNLRELGSGNTLILLNGRRLVLHPFTQDVDETPRAVVNVNVLPSNAISRTEILKDGASAVYGADATAGVLNLIFKEDYDRIRISLVQREADGLDFASSTFRFSGGWDMNNGATHLNLFASIYERGDIAARDRPYAASVDKRSFLPAGWENDVNFRNLLGGNSPWGQFRTGNIVAPGEFANIDAGTETNSNGLFHIQPRGNPDIYGVSTGLLATGVDIDNGNLDVALRYDHNIGRILTPKIGRTNIFFNMEHDFNNGIGLFAEILYYESESDAERASQPIDEGLAPLVVPRTNYWNPFGPTQFSGIDGGAARANPNRLSGLTIGDDGLDVLIDSWRVTDIGPRIVRTESSTYRLLVGLRGIWRDWDWESAMFYNYADVSDRTDNLMSKTLLAEQLTLDTEDAINPFGGPGSISAAQLDRVRISVENEADSDIGSWDIRLSRNDIFRSPAANDSAGIAFGYEWRRSSYEDDRDPRLDGSIPYNTGFGTGIGGDISDVAGISPTLDSKANRNVYSFYAELLIPVVTDRRGANRFDIQLAARLERLDDIDETVTAPKVALAWRPVSWLTFRGTYSEGFRAPNLVQLFRGDVSRLRLGFTDFWRSRPDVNLNFDDGESNFYRRTIRESDPNLKPEDTETSVLGVQFNIPVHDDGNIFIGVDLWRFKQINVIDNFGAEEQLALDFLLRSQGSQNPFVVRAAPTADEIEAFVNAGLSASDAAGRVLYIRDPYINLDPRTVRGIDYTMRFEFPNSVAGSFVAQLSASHLLTYDQDRPSLRPLLNDPILRNEFAAIAEDRIRVDGRPRWRSSGSLSWRLRNWGASWSFNYIDSFLDTSATNDTTGEFWEVDDWFIMNLSLDYRFDTANANRARVRLSMTNIEDKDPPLSDSSRGYESSYHNNRGRAYTLSFLFDL